MITIILLTYIVFWILCIRLSHKRCLFNDQFWLLASWILIVSVHVFSGVKWKYIVSAETYIYIVLCFAIYFAFRYLGLHSKVRTYESKAINYSRLRIFKIIGWVGAVMFTINYIMLNGIFDTGKSLYQLSIIGSIGALMTPILLVTGLYEMAFEYKKEQKLKLKLFLPIIGYCLPCILNSGRESLLYVVIGVISVLYAIRSSTADGIQTRSILLRKIVNVLVLIVIIISIGAIIFSTTLSRFGTNEINTFLATHNVPVSIRNEAEKYGAYKFLFYNFISYFGHQLPFLEFVIHNYNGPHLMGMYELNIISRRLPSFFDLDYRTVYSFVDNAFNGSWQTVIGSFIFDFGVYITPVIVAIFGLITGRLRRKFLISNSLERITLNGILCIAMFTTIQLGPFYNILVYGSFIWWAIIFMNIKIGRNGKS